jgi:hypothetical protein
LVESRKRDDALRRSSRTWSYLSEKNIRYSARDQKTEQTKKKKENVCDSQIKKQKMETIIINEKPKGEVARREQSEEWMMGVWMDGMNFMRKVSRTMAKGKRRVGITLLQKRDGVVRYSIPEVKEVFLAQPVLLGCGLRHLASGPSASAAGARAVPARPASSQGSAVVAR